MNEYESVQVTSCYGTHFSHGGNRLELAKNFIARLDGNQIMCVSYTDNSPAGQGEGSFACKEYKFIDMKTMESIPMSVIVDKGIKLKIKYKE